MSLCENRLLGGSYYIPLLNVSFFLSMSHCPYYYVSTVYLKAKIVMPPQRYYCFCINSDILGRLCCYMNFLGFKFFL